MLQVVKRFGHEALPNITSLSIVFDALRQEDSEGIFYDPEAEELEYVRRISRKEFDPRRSDFRARVSKYLPERQFNELLGINTLQFGIEKNDERIMEAGFKLLAGPPSRSFDPSWRWGGTPDEFANHMLFQRAETIQMMTVAWYAKFLRRAHLGYWVRFKGHRMEVQPCIYCPTFATALAVNLIFHDVIRLCPQCERIFVPERQDSPCCTPKHSAAYRTARFRRNQQEKKR